MFTEKINNRECKSSHHRAEYATTEVMITRNKLVSCDWGYDKTDKQVWGSEYGGYIFKKN